VEHDDVGVGIAGGRGVLAVIAGKAGGRAGGDCGGGGEKGTAVGSELAHGRSSDGLRVAQGETTTGYRRAGGCGHRNRPQGSRGPAGRAISKASVRWKMRQSIPWLPLCRYPQRPAGSEVTLF